MTEDITDYTDLPIHYDQEDVEEIEQIDQFKTFPI